jgi:cell division septation protein DedD
MTQEASPVFRKTTATEETMSRKTITSSLIAAVICAIGLAVGLGVTAQPANAWDITQLPAPYTVSSFYNVAAQTGECQTFYVITWYDQSVTLGYGAPVNTPNFTDCNPQFQYRLDQFVDATINQTPPVTTTTATTTEAAPPPVLPPTTTDAQPPESTTSPTTSVPTVTVTTTIVDPTILARLASLEAYYAALAVRVGALEAANTAAWDAFTATLTAGGSPADAALAARSAGLNALYQLA